MKTIAVQPVIMAGGSGTRLWPLSRAGFPKQFLVLSGHTSLFQQAAARLQGLGDAQLGVAAPVVVGNEEHRFLVLDQLRDALKALELNDGELAVQVVARDAEVNQLMNIRILHEGKQVGMRRKAASTHARGKGLHDVVIGVRGNSKLAHLAAALHAAGRLGGVLHRG